MSGATETRTLASSDVDNLWAPRTPAFLAAVVAVNVAFDLALIATLVWHRWQSMALGRTISPDLRLFFEGMTIGSFLAQTVIVAIWTALLTGKSTTRLLAGTLLVMVATAALAVPVETTGRLAMYLQTGIYDVEPWGLVAEALSAAPMYLLFYYCAQMPFWILRYTSGMRITRNAEVRPRADRALRLLDLFGVLAFLAIAMAAGRLAVPEREVWIFFGVVGLAVGVMWLMGFLLLIAALGTRGFVLRVVIVLGLCEFFALGISFAYQFFEPRLGLPRALVAFHGVALSIAILTLGNSAAARAYGYRLIWISPWSKAVASAPRSATST